MPHFKRDITLVGRLRLQGLEKHSKKRGIDE